MLSRRRALMLAGASVLGVAAVGTATRPRLVNARPTDQLRCGVRAARATLAGQQTQSTASGWHTSSANPVLDVVAEGGWETAAVYDPCVVRMSDGSLRMWYSTRGSLPSSVGVADDATGSGEHWARLSSTPVLTPEPTAEPPYDAVTRPSVVQTERGWRMWYSTVGQDHGAGTAWIGSARSTDGLAWSNDGQPVLTPKEGWEKRALQCPNVRYDDESGLYQLWFSGGDEYEPDAVGYATSRDGVEWTRHQAEPVFAPEAGWEDYKIGSFQVVRVDDWYYAFYNAFQRDPFVSRIGMARSRDGIGGWERHPANPILSVGQPCDWNGAMVYKPSALWNNGREGWDVWFNASMLLNREERIGHAWSESIW